MAIALEIRMKRPLLAALSVTLVALALLGFLSLLSGCDFAVRQYSATMTEPATVADLAYVPAGHGSGVGISMKGDLSVSSVDIPERYAVVFHCNHGKFVVEGSQYKPLWLRLREGQPVTVLYREVRECRKVDGVVKPETCRTVDLDFLDAVPRGVE